MAMRGFSFLPRVSIPEAIKGLAIGNVTQYLANCFIASHLQELSCVVIGSFAVYSETRKIDASYLQ
jgi:hypothetical protein